MKKYIITLLIVFTFLFSNAQIIPLKGQYFHNEYLSNPAMAGFSGKSEVFVNYSNQWTKVEGAPVNYSLSASTPLNDKAAVGFNVVREELGLLSKTNSMASFAYNIKLTDEQNLRFGASVSWIQDRIDLYKASSSSHIDPEMMNYNNRENYVDGNAGVYYNYKNFSAQLSYLSLNQVRTNNFINVNYATYYGTLGYKLVVDEGFSIKPLIAFRGYKKIDNQMDFALELSLQQLKFYTMYHSNSSLTAGIGYLDKGGFVFTAMYNSGMKKVEGLNGGIFDIVLGYRF